MKKMVCMLLVLLNILSLFGCASTEESGRATSATTTAATTEEPKTGFVEVMREGETDQIPVVYVNGTVGSYTIATDPAYFTFSSRETVDMFAYEGWPGEQAVYYAISAYSGGYDPDTFIGDSLKQFEGLYGSYRTEATTVGDYPATVICFDGYRDAPEYCRHVYLVDCGSACYLIETEFTMEMYEGLYAIMGALFDTFTVK